jgi:hypothetical protein
MHSQVQLATLTVRACVDMHGKPDSGGSPQMDLLRAAGGASRGWLVFGCSDLPGHKHLHSRAIVICDETPLPQTPGGVHCAPRARGADHSFICTIRPQATTHAVPWSGPGGRYLLADLLLEVDTFRVVGPPVAGLALYPLRVG